MIIGEMQNKLATWSLPDKERKFDRLLRIIVNQSWLQEAARVTLASNGAKTPGIFHRLSYGFRPERSVHHAIRTVTFQLQDSTDTSGRWVIEGDLSSYFDTVHHKLLMKCVKKRIRDARFLSLLWRFIKAGHIDKGLFRAASEGVPQGGVISPLIDSTSLLSISNSKNNRLFQG